MWVCKAKSSREFDLKIIGKILSDLYETFNSINPRNILWVGLSLENLYHNLFQIRICSIQIDFIAIFLFELVHTIYKKNL